MKYRITGVVLAGGASKRMGRSKAQLPVGDRRMIEWIVRAMDCLFDEIIVVTHHPQSFPMLENVHFVQDAVPVATRSSLVGLYTGLLHARNETIFVVPCDMPLLNRGLIEYMIGLLDGEDVRVPMTGSHFQPLHAFYRKTCLPHMRRSIDQQQYKVIHFYDEVLVRTVDEATIKTYDPELISFMNVNSEEDYQRVLSLWETMKESWHCDWVQRNPFNQRREQRYDKHRPAGNAQRKRQNSYF